MMMPNNSFECDCPVEDNDTPSNHQDFATKLQSITEHNIYKKSLLEQRCSFEDNYIYLSSIFKRYGVPKSDSIDPTLLSQWYDAMILSDGVECFGFPEMFARAVSMGDLTDAPNLIKFVHLFFDVMARTKNRNQVNTSKVQPLLWNVLGFVKNYFTRHEFGLVLLQYASIFDDCPAWDVLFTEYDKDIHDIVDNRSLKFIKRGECMKAVKILEKTPSLHDRAIHLCRLYAGSIDGVCHFDSGPVTDSHPRTIHSPFKADTFESVIEYYALHNRYDTADLSTSGKAEISHDWPHFTNQISACSDVSDVQSIFALAVSSCDPTAPGFCPFINSFVDSIVRFSNNDILGHDELRILLFHLLGYSKHKLGREEFGDLMIHVACILDHQASWDYIMKRYPECPKAYDYYSLRLIYNGDVRKAVKILCKGATLDECLYRRAVYLERVYGTSISDYFKVLAASETDYASSLEGGADSSGEHRMDIEHTSPITTTVSTKRPKPDSVEAGEPSSDNTVFVSNLDYHLPLTRIKRFFSEDHKLGPCHVKMHRHPDGRFKGFAQVQFDSGDADMDKKMVNTALKLDRTPLDSRPVFISAFQPDPEARVNKASLSSIDHSSRNPRVLYVSHLPPTCTEEQLHQLFNKYSGIKQVRMIYRKSGRFRGCAYVEFRSEVNASRGLKENGVDLDGYKIAVAISDPSLAPNKGLQGPKKHISLASTREGTHEEQKERQKEPVGSNEAFRARLGLK